MKETIYTLIMYVLQYVNKCAYVANGTKKKTTTNLFYIIRISFISLPFLWLNLLSLFHFMFFHSSFFPFFTSRAMCYYLNTHATILSCQRNSSFFLKLKVKEEEENIFYREFHNRIFYYHRVQPMRIH